MQKQLDHLEHMIFWQEHVRDNTRDPKQKARCNAAIERLMADMTEIKREYFEKQLDAQAMN